MSCSTRDRRERLGWTQGQLAEAAAVSPRVVWNIEHDRVAGRNSLAAVQRALDTAEQQRLAEYAERRTVDSVGDAPPGTTVIWFPVGDGRGAVGIAVEPGTVIDAEKVRAMLLDIHEQATARRPSRTSDQSQ